MWLLNTASRRLEYFNDERSVEGGYAILSHCWALEEVTFEEFYLESAKRKRGYQKITCICSRAYEDKFKYVWIDTCCIDKRSSAELSEAINSMFRWYQNARVCYVYLGDFEYDDKEQKTESRFRESRWWARGWTLQELIAPELIWFYDKDWRYFGSKMKLLHAICDITRIDIEVLKKSQAMHSMSVAKRMSWASRRATSREEDQAYSLLGIFNVNMPLLYGEGGVKAFHRLQEEIIHTSTFADHSILAWIPWAGAPFHEGRPEPADYHNLFASSPYGFRHAQRIVSWDLPQPETFTLTSSGLHLSLLAQPAPINVNDSDYVTAMLNCRYEDERMSYIIISLQKRLRVDEGFAPQSRKLIHDIYDRSHRGLRTRARLKAITSSEVPGEKIEFTLARKPYVWPPFEGHVHISRSRSIRTLHRSLDCS